MSKVGNYGLIILTMFSLEAKSLIATMWDWYMGDSFTYIKVYGSNIAHMLPTVILDRLIIEELSFQIVREGIYKKCAEPKRKVWPMFPIKFSENTGMQVSTRLFARNS